MNILFTQKVIDNIFGSTFIQGTYRGNPASFFYNPGTGNVIITNPMGSLIAGFKISPNQLNYLFTTGNVY